MDTRGKYAILKLERTLYMSIHKIEELVALYRRKFQDENIPIAKAESRKTIGGMMRYERLSHAHYLLDEIGKNSTNPSKVDRDLGTIQTIMSLEYWYTLAEVEEHNRPN